MSLLRSQGVPYGLNTAYCKRMETELSIALLAVNIATEAVKRAVQSFTNHGGSTGQRSAICGTRNRDGNERDYFSDERNAFEAREGDFRIENAN